MSDFYDALIAKQEHDQAFDPNRIITKGELVEVDGAVEVTDRPSWCWVKEYSQHGGVFQAFNVTTAKLAGTPVLIAHSPKVPSLRQVLSLDFETLANYPGISGDPTMPDNFPYLPEHHGSHEWREGTYGSDPVNVYLRAFVPLRTQADSGLTVSIAPLSYHYQGARVRYAGGTLDLSSHEPGTASKARRVLVYLDKIDNTIKAIAGEIGVDNTAVPLPHPSIPASSIPSCFVRLAKDQTSFTEASDFEEARFPFGGTSPASGGGGGESDDSMSTLPCCGV